MFGFLREKEGGKEGGKTSERLRREKTVREIKRKREKSERGRKVRERERDK